MTLVQFKNKPGATVSFNNFMDDLFPTVPSLFREAFKTPGSKHFTPVNVKENEQGYILDVIAPGFDKEDFKVNVEHNILTIVGEKKAEDKIENERLLRSEYNLQSFKRSFTIDEKIDADNISAKYVNGVLSLNLPRLADVKEATKQITIS